MVREEFLKLIYQNIHVDMIIQKPRKVSRILEITNSGSIYYLIGDANRKAVTRHQLGQVYDELSLRPLTTKRIHEIVTKSNPCNVTTIKWLLKTCALAFEDENRCWQRSW